jgi:hypothetical protein
MLLDKLANKVKLSVNFLEFKRHEGKRERGRPSKETIFSCCHLFKDNSQIIWGHQYPKKAIGAQLSGWGRGVWDDSKDFGTGWPN